MTHHLEGQKYTFADGNSITVKQVKIRDENIEHVIYHVQNGPGIPQQLVLPMHEFIDYYGHLFGVKTDDIS